MKFLNRSSLFCLLVASCFNTFGAAYYCPEYYCDGPSSGRGFWVYHPNPYPYAPWENDPIPGNLKKICKEVRRINDDITATAKAVGQEANRTVEQLEPVGKSIEREVRRMSKDVEKAAQDIRDSGDGQKLKKELGRLFGKKK